jgi:hypothetical protein
MLDLAKRASLMTGRRNSRVRKTSSPLRAICTRSNYANGPLQIRLYPDPTARMWEAFGCASLIVSPPESVVASALIARFTTDQAAA